MTQANTSSSQIIAISTAEGNAAITLAEGAAYKDFVSPAGLNFTEKELLQYFYIKKVMSLSENTVVGFSDSSLFSVNP